MQRGSIAVLWCAVNHHTHIKSTPATKPNLTQHLLEKNSTTSLQPNTNAKAKSQTSAQTAGCSCI
jgi:hypothetical protein